MKKKFFRFLLLALTVTGTGLVSSCKDYDEDLYEQQRLQEDSDVKALQDYINQCKEECNNKITDLTTALDNYKKEMEQKLNDLNNKLADLEKKDAELAAKDAELAAKDAELAAKDAELLGMIEELQQEITTLNGEIADLQNQIADLQNQIDQLKDRIVVLEGQVADHDTRIAALEEAIEQFNEALANFGVDNFATYITNIQNLIYQANQTSNAQIDSLSSAMDSISYANKIDFDSLYAMVADLQNVIETKADQYLWSDSLKAAYDMASDAYAKAEANYLYITALQNAQAITDSLITALQAAQGLSDSRIDSINSVIGSRLDGIDTDISELSDEIAKVRKEAAANLKTAKSYAYDAFTKARRYADGLLLESKGYTDEQIEDVLDSMDDLYSKIKNYNDSLFAASKDYSDDILSQAKDYSDDILSQAKDYSGDILSQAKDYTDDMLDAAKLYADDLYALNKAEIDNLKTRVSDNESAISDLTSQVNDLKDRMSAAEDRMSAVEKSLAKMITSVVIQGAVNPVYGSFSIPAGITSNVLVAYYGQSDASRPFDFPTIKTSPLVYGDALTEADMEMIGNIATYTVPTNEIITASNADNAGKLYLTVNPNTADLSDARFSIVNSRDKEINVTISDLVPSKETLTFGWTRAGVAEQSTNGFYEASVKIEPEQVEALKPNFDKSAVKSAIKDVISYDNGINFTNVAETMFEQLSGILDAYAIKATWKDSEEHNVYSNYGLAVTAIKPLSYAFDISGLTDKRLPVISPISEKELFSFEDIDEVVTTFTVHGIETPFSSHEIQFDGNDLYINYNGDMYKLNNADSLISKIDLMVDENIEVVRQRINDWVYALQDDINETISDLSGKLTDNINDLVDDALDDVNGTVNDYINKANKWINRLNKVVNRLNSAFDNVNSKLQVMAIYEGADGEYHQLSNNQIIPSNFVGNGGIEIKLSSYTAELVAPAMKKFVAVTNVFKNSASAQNGDAACLDALKAANTGDFGKVIDGNSTSVIFVPQNGYTYEIYYAGLDYSGKISARKFYVKVK